MNKITKRILEQLNSEFNSLVEQEEELVKKLEAINQDISDIQVTVGLLKEEEENE